MRKNYKPQGARADNMFFMISLLLLRDSERKMLKKQACAKFQSQIFDESEVIQVLKVVRWHFCQVYTYSHPLVVLLSQM